MAINHQCDCIKESCFLYIDDSIFYILYLDIYGENCNKVMVDRKTRGHNDKVFFSGLKRKL